MKVSKLTAETYMLWQRHQIAMVYFISSVLTVSLENTWHIVLITQQLSYSNIFWETLEQHIESEVATENKNQKLLVECKRIMEKLSSKCPIIRNKFQLISYNFHWSKQNSVVISMVRRSFYNLEKGFLRNLNRMQFLVSYQSLLSVRFNVI